MTGATGFIGRHALEPLLARGFEVHATYRTQSGSRADVIWHRIDLHDEALVATLTSDIRASHLLHFAWYAEHGKFWNSEDNLRSLEASLSLFRDFAGSGGRRIVGIGSSAEYQTTDTRAVENTTPLIPSTVYGAAKCALGTVLAQWAAQRGISHAWARIFHLFGPDENAERLIPALTRAALSHSAVDCGRAEQTRDFTHVADVGEACAVILASDVTGPVNIGSGNPVRLDELAALIERATGANGIARFGARSPGPLDAMFFAPDVTRLHREIGWKPAASLEERIHETVHWWAARLGVRLETPERQAPAEERPA